MNQQELTIGTHVVSPRLGYLHHGIYVGQGRVVHYAGFSRLLLRGPVRESSLPEFTRGRGYQVAARHAVRFAPEEVVARARSRLGENRYRLLSNNCEHFCAWCLTGEPRSEQVDAWLERAGRWLRRWQRPGRSAACRTTPLRRLQWLAAE